MTFFLQWNTKDVNRSLFHTMKAFRKQELELHNGQKLHANIIQVVYMTRVLYFKPLSCLSIPNKGQGKHFTLDSETK